MIVHNLPQKKKLGMRARDWSLLNVEFFCAILQGVQTLLTKIVVPIIQKHLAKRLAEWPIHLFERTSIECRKI